MMVVTSGAGDEPSEVRRALSLFEDMKSKFQVVLEGQTGLTERLDRLERSTAQDHQTLKTYLFDGLEKAYGDLGAFESRLKVIEGRT